MSECTTEFRLKTGFRCLSEERKSEILGIAEAFTYAQKGEVTGAVLWAIAEDFQKKNGVLSGGT